TTLDVRAGEHQGRIYRMLPRDRGARPVPTLNQLTTAELVETLRSPNGTVRDLAQQLLRWRNDRSVIPPLQTLAIRADAEPTARTAALWVLASWKALTPDIMRTVLQSPEPRVRRQAVCILGENYTDIADAGALLPLLQTESDPAVLFELTNALRSWPTEHHPAWLAQLYGLHFGDAWLRFAILRAVSPADWGIFATAVVDSDAVTRAIAIVEPLLSISLAEEHSTAIAAVLDRVLPTSAGESPRSWRLVEQIVQAKQRQPKLFADFMNPARTQRLAEVLTLARAKFVAPVTTDAVRAEVAGLVSYSQGDTTESVTLLLARLTPQSSPVLQAKIIAAVDQTSGARAPALLLERWSALGPAARNDVVDRLLGRPAGARSVMDAMANGSLPVGALDAARRQAVLQHRDAGVRKLAARVLQAEGASARGAVVAQHRDVLSLSGDAQRGRDVFTKRCLVCHVWEGQGHAVGPDLGESRNKPWTALLESILDPNRAVDQRYAVYTAITTDGRSVQGLVSAENETSVTLKAQEAKLTTLQRADLEEFGSQGRSLMPEGLERDLSPQDFADVFALVTQRGESGEAAVAPIAEIAKQILDESKPRAEREALVAAHLDRAAELIDAMANGLGRDMDEEYRRIPWIWRVAIAVGKRNRTEPLRDVLRASLPRTSEPLADWQAVVIGGGLINGISQAGAWPHERFAELIGNDRELRDRWQHAASAAIIMSDNENVRTGTRYDALRMVALLGWNRSGPQLVRYLAADAHAELQMGAVSGLVDVPDPQATEALVRHLPGFAPRNRDLALDGLLRSDARMLAVLDAVAKGQLSAETLGPARCEQLRTAMAEAVKQRAAKVLPAAP
ncbi:MAG TPA: c-type cytochrome, partial [Planctomycetaceae bacterium]|nr:c-type cytochrome [Planctomycetaceae bacterium]